MADPYINTRVDLYNFDLWCLGQRRAATLNFPVHTLFDYILVASICFASYSGPLPGKLECDSSGEQNTHTIKNSMSTENIKIKLKIGVKFGGVPFVHSQQRQFSHCSQRPPEGGHIMPKKPPPPRSESPSVGRKIHRCEISAHQQAFGGSRDRPRWYSTQQNPYTFILRGGFLGGNTLLHPSLKLIQW